MSFVTERAGNAIDTEQELAEFQTTHEVKIIEIRDLLTTFVILDYGISTANAV